MGKRTRSSESGKRTSRLRSMVTDASNSALREEETDTASTSSSRKEEVQETDAEVSNLQQEETALTESTPPLLDLINEEGILFSMISRLTLREAVRASVLSRRWRHLWTYIRGLKFASDTMLDAQSMHFLNSLTHMSHRSRKNEFLKGKTDQFIASVNSVLQHHQGAPIDSFHVQFFLHKIHSHHLDAWVRFAVASDSKTLEFHLGEMFTLPNSQVELYEFPCHFMTSSSTNIFALSYASLRQSRQFDGFKHITQLFLYAVDITKEDFNLLLSSCSPLEKMGLSKLRHIVTLDISHPLQTLAVEDCNLLIAIETNTTNLTKLTYLGKPIMFEFGVPSKLVYADICYETHVYMFNLAFNLSMLHMNMPHIQSLTMRISGFSKTIILPKTSDTFNHLKCLDFTWNLDVKMDHLHLATILDAAPFLEELKLRFRRHIPKYTYQGRTKLFSPLPEHLHTHLKTILIPEHLHTHLKTILIRDFCCDMSQIDIALYLLKNLTEPASMTIHLTENALFLPLERHVAFTKNFLQEVQSKAKLVIV